MCKEREYDDHRIFCNSKFDYGKGLHLLLLLRMLVSFHVLLWNVWNVVTIHRLTC